MRFIIRHLKTALRFFKEGKKDEAWMEVRDAYVSAGILYRKILPAELRELEKLRKAIEQASNKKELDPEEIRFLIELAEQLEKEEMLAAART